MCILRPDIAPSARQPPRDYGVDRRTNERFPDNQQVFVGNLPQDVAELQLKNFFKGERIGMVFFVWCGPT